MADEDNAFRLGSMDARLGAVEKDLAEVKGDVKTLLARSAESKGGKGALAAAGGGGVSVGALIVAVAQWLGLGGQPQHVTETRTETSTLRETVPAPVHDTRN